MPTELKEKTELLKDKATEVLNEALAGGNQMEAPTEYVTFLP